MKESRPDADLESREPMRIVFALAALLLGLAATIGTPEAGTPAAKTTAR